MQNKAKKKNKGIINNDNQRRLDTQTNMERFYNPGIQSNLTHLHKNNFDPNTSNKISKPKREFTWFTAGRKGVTTK
jgi:hypothetical protein